MVSITITEREANLFTIFRQYQSIWEGIFNEIQKKKIIELHFDNNGILEFAETNKRYYNVSVSDSENTLCHFIPYEQVYNLKGIINSGI